MSDSEPLPSKEGPPAREGATSPADDAAYEPLPAVGESAASVLARLEAAQRAQSAPQPAAFDEDKQLSLGQLLLVTLLLAGVMGLLRLVDFRTGAGMLGFGLLIAALLLGFRSHGIPLVARLTWWGLIAIYVITLVAAYRQTGP
jgi:hypothetical protein